jgi:acetylornithine deacetylase/succinyl-diaminopimelate desuccinylase-like protein
MTAADDIRRRVTDHVERHSDALVAFLTELVRIPSVYPPGTYDQIAQRMKQAYDELGVEADLIAAPRPKVEACGLSYPRPNVAAIVRGAAPRPVLMLSTHLDVVPAGDLETWRFDPFAGHVAEGRVWGRGACDAKCAMAAHVFAVRALVETGVRLNGSVMCVASVDDEARFDSVRWSGMTFLAQEGLRDAGYPMPDMVINGEASGLASICGAFKGRLILELTVRGETAHAATPYGVSAIDKALDLMAALRQIELKRHPLFGEDTLNVCALTGVSEPYGDIPHTCSVGLEIRVVPPFGTGRMREEIARVVARVAEAPPPAEIVETKTFSEREPFEIGAEHPLVVAITDAARAVGLDARYAGIVGTGELQPFLRQGIPGVTYGAGSIDRVHRTNEYVEIEELVNQAKIYALTALNICG